MLTCHRNRGLAVRSELSAEDLNVLAENCFSDRLHTQNIARFAFAIIFTKCPDMVSVD